MMTTFLLYQKKEETPRNLFGERAGTTGRDRDKSHTHTHTRGRDGSEHYAQGVDRPTSGRAENRTAQRSGTSQTRDVRDFCYSFPPSVAAAEGIAGQGVARSSPAACKRVMPLYLEARYGASGM